MKKLSYLIVSFLIALLFLYRCEKEELPFPEVSTAEVTDITAITALSGGTVISDAGSTITSRGVCWSTNPDPKITDSKTTDGSGAGSFISELTGLTPTTSYYIRAYATNNNGTGYGMAFSFTTLAEGNTFTDHRDGQVYRLVEIGNQVWMAENLKATHYANGTAIQLVTGNSNWDALNSTSKAYCWYNDDIANKATYGALYTWAAAMNGALSNTANPSGIQGVCPTGWHLPSDAEWIQMENYLAENGYNYDGTIGGGRDKIAKSLASTSGWVSNTAKGAVGNTDYPTYRNKSGFTALPGGYRNGNGTFLSIGYNGNWWSATEFTTYVAWGRYIEFYKSIVGRDYSSGRFGFSVRCVKD